MDQSSRRTLCKKREAQHEAKAKTAVKPGSGSGSGSSGSGSGSGSAAKTKGLQYTENVLCEDEGVECRQHYRSNEKRRMGKTSQFVGVSLDRNGRWVAKLGASGWIGTYDTESKAAAAYKQQKQRKAAEVYTYKFAQAMSCKCKNHGECGVTVKKHHFTVTKCAWKKKHTRGIKCLLCTNDAVGRSDDLLHVLEEQIASVPGASNSDSGNDSDSSDSGGASYKCKNHGECGVTVKEHHFTVSTDSWKKKNTRGIKCLLCTNGAAGRSGDLLHVLEEQIASVPEEEKGSGSGSDSDSEEEEEEPEAKKRRTNNGGKKCTGR
jgi:hypothetical protein